MRLSVLLLWFLAACDGAGGSSSEGEHTGFFLDDAGDINEWDGGVKLSDWVPIQGGVFEMGSKEEVGEPMERPRHDVEIMPFYMWRTEVTVDQYRRCVTRGGCTEPLADNDYCNWRYEDRGEHPVNCIDWAQSEMYCDWVGGRLPSEAEWEFAARGRGLDVYPWGNEEPTCELAVIDENESVGCGAGSTWPVCSKPKGNTALGLCDLAGNVYEWVQDWMHPGYEYIENGELYRAPDDGSAWEEPFYGNFRMMRGGGIGSDDGYRAAHRQFHDPEFHYGGLGVRCARSATSNP